MKIRIKFIILALIISFMNISLFAFDRKINNIKVHYIGYFTLNENELFKKYIELYCINGVRYMIVHQRKYVAISPLYDQKGHIKTCAIRNEK